MKTNEVRRTIEVYDEVAGRTVKQSFTVSGAPVNVRIPQMLDIFGYARERSTCLKVLRGTLNDEGHFSGVPGGPQILVMECWSNPNGYLGAHEMMTSREIALNHGADFFGEFTNIDPQCGLPDWGVDYSVFSLDLLTRKEMAKFEREYQQCRAGKTNGHRPLSKETVAKMQRIFGVPAAYAAV